jgi:hypothetical protein
MDILTAVLSSLVADLVKWLIRWAVLQLPERARERYREEWQAHLNELPGFIRKLSHALGCWKAVAVELRNKPRRVQTSADLIINGKMVVEAKVVHDLEALPLITSSPVLGTPTLESFPMQHQRVMSPALWESLSKTRRGPGFS